MSGAIMNPRGPGDIGRTSGMEIEEKLRILPRANGTVRQPEKHQSLQAEEKQTEVTPD
jgi:hypothetical protein